MSASRKYRDYAGECLDWARTAGSDEEREIFLQMAQTWLAAAVQVDLRDRPDRTPPPDAMKPYGSNAA